MNYYKDDSSLLFIGQQCNFFDGLFQSLSGDDLPLKRSHSNVLLTLSRISYLLNNIEVARKYLDRAKQIWPISVADSSDKEPTAYNIALMDIALKYREGDAALAFKEAEALAQDIPWNDGAVGTAIILAGHMNERAKVSEFMKLKHKYDPEFSSFNQILTHLDIIERPDEKKAMLEAWLVNIRRYENVSERLLELVSAENSLGNFERAEKLLDVIKSGGQKGSAGEWQADLFPDMKMLHEKELTVLPEKGLQDEILLQEAILALSSGDIGEAEGLFLKRKPGCQTLQCVRFQVSLARALDNLVMLEDAKKMIQNASIGKLKLVTPLTYFKKLVRGLDVTPRQFMHTLPDSSSSEASEPDISRYGVFHVVRYFSRPVNASLLKRSIIEDARKAARDLGAKCIMLQNIYLRTDPSFIDKGITSRAANVGARRQHAEARFRIVRDNADKKSLGNPTWQLIGVGESDGDRCELPDGA